MLTPPPEINYTALNQKLNQIIKKQKPLGFIQSIPSTSTSHTYKKKRFNQINDTYSTPIAIRDKKHYLRSSEKANSTSGKANYYQNLLRAMTRIPEFGKIKQMPNDQKKLKKKPKFSEVVRNENSNDLNLLEKPTKHMACMNDPLNKIQVVSFLKQQSSKKIQLHQFKCFQEYQLPIYKRKSKESLDQLQKLTQDDDVSSDDEVVRIGIMKCIKDLAQAFSENKINELNDNDTKISKKILAQELQKQIQQKIIQSYEKKNQK